MAIVYQFASPVKDATHVRIYEILQDPPDGAIRLTGQLGTVQPIVDPANPEGIDLGDGTEFIVEPGVSSYRDTIVAADVSRVQTAGGSLNYTRFGPWIDAGARMDEKFKRRLAAVAP